MKIKQVSAEKLKPHPKNPRVGDLTKITTSILKNGFYGALLVRSETNEILAGNHRFKAGVSLGMPTFPVIFLDVDEKQALVILAADNRASDGKQRIETEFIEALEALNASGVELSRSLVSEKERNKLLFSDFLEKINDEIQDDAPETFTVFLRVLNDKKKIIRLRKWLKQRGVTISK